MAGKIYGNNNLIKWKDFEMCRTIEIRDVAALYGVGDNPDATVKALFNRHQREFEGNLRIKIPNHMLEDTSRFGGPKVITSDHSKLVLDKWLRAPDYFGKFEVDFIPFKEYGLDNAKRLLENIIDLLRDNNHLRSALHLPYVLVSHVVDSPDELLHRVPIPTGYFKVAIQEHVVENFKAYSKKSLHKSRLHNFRNKRIIELWEGRGSNKTIEIFFTLGELEELAEGDFSLPHEVLNTILTHEKYKEDLNDR